jgi:ATP/maltotriose-dependent transcriptional regulator MalT
MALEIYRSLGNARLSGIYGLNVGVQAYADGRWDEAAELYAEAQVDCLRAGDRPHAAHIGSSLAELLISRGRLDEAERLLVDSRRVLRASTFRALALFAEIQLGRCTLERGNAAGAVGSLESVAGEAATVGYAAIVLEAGVYLAQAHAQAGSAAAGLASLDAAVAAAGEEAALYAAAVERVRAACLAALGRHEEARDLLDRALASAEKQGLLYEQLLAHRARLEAGDARANADEELLEINRLEQLLGVG